MGQGLLDMFAAAGFALCRFLMIGLNSQTMWFWLLLAAVGLIWSIYLAALEVGGIEIVLKQCGCILLSIFLLAGYKSVDLAEYTYAYPGQIEKEFSTSKGGAPLPTYGTFLVGRAFATDIRNIISTGKTMSIPDVAGEVELLTTDPELLKDSQLRANLTIWNQVVAPYLLKKDPELVRGLEAANLMGEFMNPIPNVPDFVGSVSARSEQVQALLAKTSVPLGDMHCTLASLIDSVAASHRANAWSSGTGTCISPDIKLNFAATELPTASPSLYTKEASRLAYSKGLDLVRRMMAVGGNATEAQSVGSFAQLYDKLGRSVLYVAGNRYANDVDKLIILGTKCDKISERSCAIAQSGIFQAAKGIGPSQSYKNTDGKPGLWEQIGKGLADFGAFGLTSIFRLVMWLLSVLVKSFMPYGMGMAVIVSMLMSVIGIYMMLIPKRFNVAVEWLLGPIAWASTWVALFGIWIEVDAWMTKIVDFISSALSNDAMMARNACSIVVSLGYLALPFFAWNIIFGSAAKALAKAGNSANRAIQGGLAFALFGASKGIPLLKDYMGSEGSGGQSTPSAPGGGGGGGNGRRSDPESRPPSSPVPPQPASGTSGDGSRARAINDPEQQAPASSLPPVASWAAPASSAPAASKSSQATPPAASGGNLPEFSFGKK